MRPRTAMDDDGWETAGPKKKKGGKKKGEDTAGQEGPPQEEEPAKEIAESKPTPKGPDADGFQEAAPKKKKNKGNKGKEEKDPPPVTEEDIELQEDAEEEPKDTPQPSPKPAPAEPPKAKAKAKSEPAGKAKAKGKAEPEPKKQDPSGPDFKLALDALKEDNGEKLRDAFSNAKDGEINDCKVDEEGYLGKETSVTVAKYTKLESFNCDTVLHLAVRNNKPDVVRACLELGIDEGITNKPGKICGKVAKGKTPAEEDENGLIQKAKEAMQVDAQRHEALIAEEGGAMPTAKKLKKRIKECQGEIEKMEKELLDKRDELRWLSTEERDAKVREAEERKAAPKAKA